MATFFRVVILSAIVLILGTGFCLFDTDHGANGGLCGLLLLSMTSVLPVFYLWLVGRFTPALVRACRLLPSDLLVPPPKA